MAIDLGKTEPDDAGEDMMRPTSQPPKDTDGSSGESDQDAPGTESPQEPAHPNITVPKMPRTAEALSLLGAGSPYINRNM